MLSACVTTKSSKKEAGWLKKKVHDMNARYNGIFNAKELYKASVTQLEGVHEDNFNQVLDIYPYGSKEDRKLVEEDMDLAIEKVVKVASLHEPSKWVDDCYVIMGKAQYLKGDYESAQETFEYFVEDFNPKDPTSRVYQSPDRKTSSKDRKKQQANERKIQEKEREKVKEEKKKSRKQEAKERKKARAQAEKERKQRNKDRKKGKRTPRKPKVEEPAIEVETKKEEVTAVASADNDIPIDPDEAYLQEIAEKERKRKEQKIEKGDGGNGGFLKHKPAYDEGMLWLTKTFIAREKWIEANYFLDKLETEAGVQDKVKEELPIVRADYFLQQKDYAKATGALVHAIDQSSDRKLKARMAFILAQAYQMNGQAAEAQKAFASVKKYKTDYIMELNAELNQLKNAWAAGSTSSADITRKLERLSKQDHNRNYLGVIYSSIAEVKLVDGDKEGALEYFQKALSNSAANSVKADIYYRLGTLFFAQEEYSSAKLYYDSTLVMMDEKDPRFKPTTRFAASLKDIAKNIDIISSQDSLLRLGSMSEEELTKFAEDKAEKEWRANKENEEGASGGFQATTSVFSADSKFFAYNQVIKQKGQRDFRKRWGDRPLEDNWRRSQKSSSTFDQEDIEEIVVSDEIPNNILQKEKAKILRGIPRDDASKKTINETIEKAMFELGTGFRAALNNYTKSNETLLRFIERYPDTKNRAEAMYFIHLNFIDLGKDQMAESFKTRLIREFPQSSFAKYLKNPTDDTALITKEREIEIYYEETYKLFEKGLYQQTSDRLVEANNKFGSKHDMIAKFELLNALCIGNLKGQNEYVNALRGVILRFDGTEEQTYAREMLRFLRGDEESFGGDDTSDEALSKYVTEDNKLHYVVAVVYDTNGDKIKKIKASIDAFNKERYSDKRLRVTGLVLNRTNNSYVVLIRRFKGKEDAMIYYRDASTRRSDFANPDTFSYDIYAINQKNYRKVIEENKVGAYRAFFDKHYLGIGK